MVNPFSTGDKVVTHLKGGEVEGTVRTTWNHEVQIRLADNDLLWRTMKKVRLVTPVPAMPEPEVVFVHTEQPPEETEPVGESVLPTEDAPADIAQQGEPATEPPLEVHEVVAKTSRKDRRSRDRSKARAAKKSAKHDH